MRGGRCAGKEVACGRVGGSGRGAEGGEDGGHVALGDGFFAVAHEEVGYLGDDGVVAVVFLGGVGDGEVGEGVFVAFLSFLSGCGEWGGG